MSLAPLHDPGQVDARPSTDLQGPEMPCCPANAIDVGHVQHRITRVTAEGSVYTISPRLILPSTAAACRRDITRTFWLTVKVPDRRRPAYIAARCASQAERGGDRSLPLRFTVRKGTLDPGRCAGGPVQLHASICPGIEDEAAGWNRAMAVKSLQKLREYGFTTVSGLPIVTYQRFQGRHAAESISRAATPR